MRWMVVRAVVMVAASAGAAPLWAQTPDTDIYLAPLSVRGGRVVIGDMLNVTRRVGYDNQPHFTRDGQALLYTAIDTTGQADIWRIRVDRTDVVPQRVTRTSPESEYSATPLTGGGFSVVRVERDSVQRLWRFDGDGSNARVVLEQVRPVGYHAWSDDDIVVMFVLGSPATLQRANVRTGELKTHASDIGRSLQRVPGERSVSFVQRTVVDGVTRWELRALQADGAVRLIAPLPELPGADGARAVTADFHAWTPEGVLLTSLGSAILAWDAAQREWYRVVDYAQANLIVTRLAVSPNGNQIAFVAQRASQR